MGGFGVLENNHFYFSDRSLLIRQTFGSGFFIPQYRLHLTPDAERVVVAILLRLQGRHG